MAFDKVDFFHNYKGFHGCDSKCHFRILDKKDKPLVIICSNLSGGNGTSVTNMAEELAYNIYEYIKKDNPSFKDVLKEYFNNNKPEQMISDIIKQVKQHKTMLLFTLESIKSALEYKSKYKERTEKIENFIWVEHYFKDHSLSRTHNFAIVNFDKDNWSPSWHHCTLEDLSNHLGYTKSDLDVESDLQKKRWKEK